MAAYANARSAGTVRIIVLPGSALADRVEDCVVAGGWTVGHEVNGGQHITLLCFDETPSKMPPARDGTDAAVCCGPGSRDWPLDVRCQFLQRGIKHFLDSSDAAFQPNLLSLLTQLDEKRRLRVENSSQVSSIMRSQGVIGESEHLVGLFRTVLRIAPVPDLPVLITGETGTGKDLLARAIHRCDPRRGPRPFVAINCAALSPSLLESELFGYRRGAFTGADRDRPGLLRSAHQGVVFLDEIGELELGLQAKMLRALQTGEITAVGDDQQRTVDIRVVAATNQPLETLVAQGRFREDLYHRLNVIRMRVLPLRERREDIAPLASHFFNLHRAMAPNVSGIADEFVDALTQSGLPGNARQIENLVRWALANKHGEGTLALDDFPPEMWDELAQKRPARKPPLQALSQDSAGETTTAILARHGGRLAAALGECERLMIESVLRDTRGNQSEAARSLGITPRCIYNKLHKHF